MEAKSGLLMPYRFVSVFILVLCSWQSVNVQVFASGSWSTTAVVENPNLTPNSVMLRHEAVTGLMPAMTMPFGVVSSSLLEGVGYRDVVEIEFRKINDHFIIHELTRVGSAKGVDSVDLLERHNYSVEVPWNIELIDSYGKPTTFQKYRHNALVVSFIYTRCPTVCPVQTARLKALVGKLELNDTKRVSFITISLDPEYDTPEKMSQFAYDRGIDKRKWSFLTGSNVGVERVLNSFNVAAIEQSTGDINHSPQVFLIKPDGGNIIAYDGMSESLIEDLYRDVNSVSNLY